METVLKPSEQVVEQTNKTAKLIRMLRGIQLQPRNTTWLNEDHVSVEFQTVKELWALTNTISLEEFGEPVIVCNTLRFIGTIYAVHWPETHWHEGISIDGTVNFVE